jgi:hypothetical protein
MVSSKGICDICVAGNPAVGLRSGFKHTGPLSNMYRDAVQLVTGCRSLPNDVFLCESHRSHARMMYTGLQRLAIDAGIAPLNAKKEPQQTMFMEVYRQRHTEALRERTRSQSAPSRAAASTAPLLMQRSMVSAGCGTRVASKPVETATASLRNVEAVQSVLIREACGKLLPTALRDSPCLFNSYFDVTGLSPQKKEKKKKRKMTSSFTWPA